MNIMTDFSLDASREFWRSFSDQRVFEVITFMERAEDWTLDGDPQVEAALEKLELAMSELQGIEISNFEQLVYIGAYLKTSRVLKIMQEMDTNNPGAASRFLGYAESADETNKAAKLFIRRNLIFERLRLISRIFDPERIKTIQEILEKQS